LLPTPGRGPSSFSASSIHAGILQTNGRRCQQRKRFALQTIRVAKHIQRWTGLIAIPHNLVHQQMVIPNQKTECLWCGRRLVGYAPEAWQTAVPRSAEHIIPQNIGGKIKTRDLCRPCNSDFGSICDHALINDQRMIRAAEAAGFKFTDFHETFKGTQKTETGGEVPTRYERGEFKPKPQLRPDSNLLVPLEEWKKLRTQIRGSLIAKVRRKNLASMDNARIASEVDKLLAAVDADPSKRHYSETIGEGFQLTVSSGPVSVPIEMFPWETDWCLAKIVVELANVTWPREYQIYFRPAIQLFRDFLQRREHDPETKSGKGIRNARAIGSVKSTSPITTTSYRWP
jgi:HNH endonuclease